jgi:hypothetical protein
LSTLLRFKVLILSALLAFVVFAPKSRAITPDSRTNSRLQDTYTDPIKLGPASGYFRQRITDDGEIITSMKLSGYLSKDDNAKSASIELVVYEKYGNHAEKRFFKKASKTNLRGKHYFKLTVPAISIYSPGGASYRFVWKAIYIGKTTLQDSDQTSVST